MSTSKTATFIRSLSKFHSDARLYRLDPPCVYPEDWGNGETCEYVVVSATTVLGVPETYIFGADENGKVTQWLELPGSFKGALDHREALDNAGYSIVTPKAQPQQEDAS